MPLFNFKDVLVDFEKFPDDKRWGLFRPYDFERIKINSKKVSDIVPERGSVGWRRAVFFYAIVILHETAHYKHENFNFQE